MVSFAKVFRNYSARDRFFTSLLIVIIGITILTTGIAKIIYNYKLSDKDSVYTEGVAGELAMINPLFTDFNEINRDLSSIIFSGLTKYNPNTKTFEPDLATFEVNKDSTIFTFTLKEDLEWHDGTPVTASDILYTYKNIIQNEKFTNSGLKQALQNVEITSSKLNEVQFKLKSPNAFFIGITSTGILPKHIYSKASITEIGLEINKKDYSKIIGSGPYKFDKIEKLDENITAIILKSYKKYHFGKPKIKTIRFLIFKDTENLLKNQEKVDSISGLSYSNKSSLDQKKFKLSNYILSQYNALFLNFDSIYLKDKSLREALLQATDKATLSEILPNKKIIGRPYFQFETINEIGKANFDDIKKNLVNSGYKYNNEEILENENNEPIILKIIAPNYSNNVEKALETKKILDHIKKSYGKLGIIVKIQLYSITQFAEKLQEKNYDIALFGHSLGNNFDSYAFWHSSQAGTGGSNLSNIKNIALDSQLERVRSVSNIDKRNEILLNINKILKTDVAAIFLYTDKYIISFTDKVKNRTILDNYSYPSDRLFNIDKWELK